MSLFAALAVLSSLPSGGGSPPAPEPPLGSRGDGGLGPTPGRQSPAHATHAPDAVVPAKTQRRRARLAARAKIAEARNVAVLASGYALLEGDGTLHLPADAREGEE